MKTGGGKENKREGCEKTYRLAVCWGSHCEVGVDVEETRGGLSVEMRVREMPRGCTENGEKTRRRCKKEKKKVMKREEKNEGR